MAVFRVERTRDYTVMSNHHLKSRALSVLPIGCILERAGSLSAPEFVTIIVLAMGIVGPILAAVSYIECHSKP